MSESQRRASAVAAAVEVAQRHGLAPLDPLVLKDSNHTVVWLRPLPVVAKVATPTVPGGSTEGLAVERDVLAYLAGRGAPVTQLADGLPRELHQAADRSVLLLNYVEHDSTRPASSRLARETLASVHLAMRDYPGALPAFTDQLPRARHVLIDPRLSPTLAADDRSLLIDTVDDFASGLSTDPSWRPLHGDPWIGGNLLWTPSGAVLVDFEAACRGPIEWDWSALPPDMTPEDLDPNRLAELRLPRSALVAAWCFAQPRRAREIDRAARHHLRLVRAAHRRPDREQRSAAQ